MTILENILIGVGLSMDALMIAYAKGLKWEVKHLIILSLYFGLFQSLMTIIGYRFGKHFIPIEFAYRNILTFILLFYVGIKIMKESEYQIDDYKILKVLLYALLTSLDAFSIGISLSLLISKITTISLTIGITTFLISFTGSMIGKCFNKLKIKHTNILGGIIILLYAIKVLVSG